MTRLVAPFVLVLVLSAAALLLPWAPLAGPEELARLIVIELRLPRLLLGLGYGAVLGLTGAALQAMFANPLASPDITGASSGAALGAVVGTTILGFASPMAMGASGAVGAALTLLLLFAVAGRRPNAATLLLAGLAISLAAGALTSLALALAPSPFAFYEAFDWLMGSLVDRSLGQAVAALVPAALAAVFLLRRSGALDRLALGEDVAASMGVVPGRLRQEVVLLSAIAIGACVAVCGAVGFVGLIAPVIARRLTRGHPGRALVPAALIGAVILIAADLLTRLAPLGRTIPLGVVTASLGTPIFLWVLLGMRGKLAS
ncbi:iron ABC transporter permease [Sphingomonas humi]|uniref:Iron ABC transporter permease n=1 Tax=Sphingomonas humi TaxID=335630 RepID=A0ABP7SAN7_9SPHN